MLMCIPHFFVLPAYLQNSGYKSVISIFCFISEKLKRAVINYTEITFAFYNSINEKG